MSKQAAKKMAARIDAMALDFAYASIYGVNDGHSGKTISITASADR